ncbi:MAG: RNA methyltransferase, partial [Deltaproteobacteria bacterium]|nr:RNA methyltransferase [Deltaproteobacteria bacterium]
MKADLDNFCVILHEPRYPENIGAAARCCRNMGIPQLIVVRPYRLDLEKMLKMATHEAADLIETMLLFDDLEEALGPFQ